jgi:hypothetical protein
MLSIGLKGLEAIIILHFSSSVIQVSKVETELNQKSQSAKKSAILAPGRLDHSSFSTSGKQHK